jgi:Protein of unknown function (DUF3761)
MRQLPALLSLLITVVAFLVFSGPAAPRPILPTAECRDGTKSYSHHARKTCLHHRGVAKWFLIVPD